MSDFKKASGPMVSVEGKRAVSKFGTLSPTFFGRTTIELHQDRVIEFTTGPISSRECHILASDVESVEITTAGSPILLVLGMVTLPLFGLGLIFLILYFVFKDQFLVIWSGSNAIAVSVRGNIEEYRSFMVNTTMVSAAYKQPRQN